MTSSTFESIEDLEREAVGTPESETATTGDGAAAPNFSLEVDQLAGIWKTIFSVLARNQGEHWNLTESEARNLGLMSAPLIDKWLPAVMMKYGAELALGSSLAMIVMSRISYDKKQKGRDKNNPGKTGVRQNDFSIAAAEEKAI